jgi:hypothetical protein
MTDPPGMVVGVSGHFGEVLFSLWNYTDAEIEVNVAAEAVPPTEALNNSLQATNIAVPSNATRSIAGHVDLGIPTYYPYRLYPNSLSLDHLALYSDLRKWTNPGALCGQLFGHRQT